MDHTYLLDKTQIHFSDILLGQGENSQVYEG